MLSSLDCGSVFTTFTIISKALVIIGTMNASDSWDRDEWQGRDMIHSHGMGSLKFNLDLKRYHDAAASAELERIQAEQRGDQDRVDFWLTKRVEEEGKLIRGLDLLISHDHPDGAGNPNEPFTMPTVHPCSRRGVEIFDMDVEEKKTHLSALHSCCGLHYKCTSYCLRRDKKTGKMRCRMHFGTDRKPLSKETRVEYDLIHDGTAVRPRIIFKRNNLKANNIIKSQMHGWGGNTDGSFCINSQKTMDYSAKYSAKGVKQTTVFIEKDMH